MLTSPSDNAKQRLRYSIMTTTAGGGQVLHTFSLMLLSCSILSVFSYLTVESLYSWRGMGGFEFKIQP